MSVTIPVDPDGSIVLAEQVLIQATEGLSLLGCTVLGSFLSNMAYETELWHTDNVKAQNQVNWGRAGCIDRRNHEDRLHPFGSHSHHCYQSLGLWNEHLGKCLTKQIYSILYRS